MYPGETAADTSASSMGVVFKVCVKQILTFSS